MIHLNGPGPTRASAVVRLCAAREELWRAEERHTSTAGTPDEPGTLCDMGEAAAELATRVEWLHWIDSGTSLRPEADGDWGRQPDARVARPHGGAQEDGPPTATARRRVGLAGRPRPSLLRSAT